MQMVNVFKATPGMVLARDVKNKDGRHLMDAGIALGEKQIRILRMWGILEVAVQGEEAGGKEKRQDHKDPELAAFLDRWLGSNTLKAPVVGSLYDLCLEWFDANPEVFSTLLSRLRAFSARKKEPIPAGISASPEALLSDTVKLPSLPRIYSEISAAVNDPKCSGKEIAEIVSKDTSLSATLLKIVNSAFYGSSEKVDSLHYAAMALGTRQVCSLAMGITVINYFKGMPEDILNMEAFWHHSLGCAIAARNLATHVPGVNADRVFVGGLLHDIGRLIFCTHFPEASGAALSKAAKLKLPLDKTEPMFFNSSHAQFGSSLAELWKFPPEITTLIRYHHGDARHKMSREESVVYFANWLTSALGIGFSGEITLAKLNFGAWKTMDIPASALVPVVRQTERQLKEAIRFFYE